jgi:soluble lytic murein transglycosylase-like protein
MWNFAILLLLAAVPAVAGEYALLATGARLRAERHEFDGGKVRLYTGGGYIELSANQVAGFEPDGPPVRAEDAKTAAAGGRTPVPAELADAAADKYGLPRRLVRSVMLAESAGQANAVSPKGAIGLMQLMPSTARLLGANPRDPAQNMEAGVRYLRDLLILYDGKLWHALAAYNAGPGAVMKYHGAIPPYAETLRYIRRIDRDYRGAAK